MPRVFVDPAAVAAVTAALDAEQDPEPATLRRAVRHLLSALESRAPGRAIEVRVPPYGAIQCALSERDPRHTRGTPPNVVETDPITWVALATGRLRWDTAVHSGQIRASGTRADLSSLLPLPSEALGSSHESSS